MKKVLVMMCMMFGCVFASKATGEKASKEKVSKAVVAARAQHLSDQMIKDLRLNNYQSKKVRELNMQVAEQISAIELQHAGNKQEIEALCQSVYADRDLALENVLSTEQYNHYFGDRKVYCEEDQKFMASLNYQEDGSIAVVDPAGTNAQVGVN
ncbi:hypothetical protein [Pontibacter chinhatensis]|uniref:Uncharacterized protein n=1 Tax=Pontibacter chinhatensis TaxID=1436961 RepID=A0A1I2XL51_9BACT|nr:hypothetical protein [Pontibacter chinhatensis]SFH12821.1 hypothetical protein SAMN05421739_10653 [Pontibacter chinhatensis]